MDNFWIICVLRNEDSKGITFVVIQAIRLQFHPKQ